MKSSFTAALLIVLGPTMVHAAKIGDYVDSCGFRFSLVDCRAGCVTTQTTAADSGVGFDLDFNNTSVDSTTGSMELSLGFAVEAIGGADRAFSDLFSVTLRTVGTTESTGYINVTENIVNAGDGTTFSSIIKSDDRNGQQGIIKEYWAGHGLTDEDFDLLTRIGFYKDHFLTPQADGSAELTHAPHRFSLTTPAPIPVPASLPILAVALR